MFGERAVEIPWLWKNIKEGSVLDIGSVEASYNYELINQGRELTLIDKRKDGINTKGNPKIKVIEKDIRKIIPEEIGKFDNVLLISTLEHIGLDAYGYTADWKDNPILEQLRTFKHCINFLKEDGRMLLTVPYGKYENAGWLITYDKEMINNIKEGYKVVNETYFTLKTEKYIECKEEDCPLLGANMVPNVGMRATSVVCLALMR